MNCLEYGCANEPRGYYRMEKQPTATANISRDVIAVARNFNRLQLYTKMHFSSYASYASYAKHTRVSRACEGDIKGIIHTQADFSETN